MKAVHGWEEMGGGDRAHCARARECAELYNVIGLRTRLRRKQAGSRPLRARPERSPPALPRRSPANLCNLPSCSNCASNSSAGTTEQIAVRARSNTRSLLSMQKNRQSASRSSARSPLASVRPRTESIAYTSMALSASAARTSCRCWSAGPSIAAHFAAKTNWRLAISAPRRSGASLPIGAGKWRGSASSCSRRITASISGISPFIARLKIIPGINSRLISLVPSKIRLTRLSR